MKYKLSPRMFLLQNAEWESQSNIYKLNLTAAYNSGPKKVGMAVSELFCLI